MTDPEQPSVGQPIVATAAGEVVVADEEITIGRPAHWVASLLWVILVSTCALIASAAAGALILNYLAGSTAQSGAKETILLIFSTSFNALVALFVSRPGTR